MCYHIKWSSFDISSVTTVEDPIATGSMAIDSFIEIYGPLLQTLDGSDMSSYVDFFFERSPCNRSVLIFVDENARLDFRDEAILMNLIPPIGDIMVGESAEERKEREEKEALKKKAIEKQRILKAAKAAETNAQKNAKMIMTAQKTQLELSKKLDDEKDEAKRAKLEEKIHKISKMLVNKKHSY